MHHRATQDSQESCQHCDGPLTTHRERREKYCGKIQCRGPYIKQAHAAAKAAKENERAVRDRHADCVRELLNHCAEEPLRQADDTRLIVVPSLEANVVKQPQERIDEFRDNLEDAASRALSEIRTDIHREMLQNTFSPTDVGDVNLAIINACTTCRGKCCLQGAGHAFLKSTELAKRLLDEPEQTPETLVEDYMSRVPEYAYEGSCLFHGAEGCVLPREVRSSTCNSFRCTGIVDALPFASTSEATVVAAVDGLVCTRAGLMQSDGVRTEFDVQQDVEDDAAS